MFHANKCSATLHEDITSHLVRLYGSNCLRAVRNRKCLILFFQVSQVLLLVPGEVPEVPQQECLHHGKNNVAFFILSYIKSLSRLQ